MGQGARLSTGAIIGIGLCLIAAVYNFTREDSATGGAGGPGVGVIWCIIALVVFVVARNRAQKRAAEDRHTERPPDR